MTNGEALKKMQAIKAYMTSGNPIWSVTEMGEAFDMAIEALEQSEPKWIPCSECMYWRDERVLMNDGKARQYNGDEPDALGIKHSVTSDVGIYQGSMCLYEEDRGWTTFRNADDFCSRAKKRPCSYYEWYGIVDGVYAKPWRGEEHA